ELIPNVAEEVLALGFGVEKFLVLFGGKGEVTIDLAAVEAQVEDASRRFVGLGRQEFRFQWPPVEIQFFCAIPLRAHDSKIVGTIALRRSGRHAATSSDGLAGIRFQGSSSAIRLMG